MSYDTGQMSDNRTATTTPMNVQVPLASGERQRLNEVCGPGRPMKRGAWVREAILAALEREEAKKATT